MPEQIKGREGAAKSPRRVLLGMLAALLSVYVIVTLVAAVALLILGLTVYERDLGEMSGVLREMHGWVIAGLVLVSAACLALIVWLVRTARGA